MSLPHPAAAAFAALPFLPGPALTAAPGPDTPLPPGTPGPGDIPAPDVFPEPFPDPQPLPPRDPIPPQPGETVPPIHS